MTFEIDVGGRTRVVSVEVAEARPGHFHVVVRDAIGDAGPRAFDVDARPTDLGVSIVYAHDGRSVDVAVTSRSAGERFLQLPHVSLMAVLGGGRSPRSVADGRSAAGGQRLTAPMPGRVVRLLVGVGDQVVARQGLVVIEAMKMENELVSARSGTVTEVVVSEGMSVEAGSLLITLN